VSPFLFGALRSVPRLGQSQGMCKDRFFVVLEEVLMEGNQRAERRPRSLSLGLKRKVVLVA
jgi:hypothetical protein